MISVLDCVRQHQDKIYRAFLEKENTPYIPPCNQPAKKIDLFEEVADMIDYSKFYVGRIR